MSRPVLAAALSLLLLATGCLGPPSTPDADESDGQEGDHVSSPRDEAIVQEHYEGSATLGMPLLDPEGSTGATESFVKTSLDHGLNGTWLLAYEVHVPADADRLVATTEGAPPTADYDLLVYGPDGELVAHSHAAGPDETATVSSPQPGNYVVAAYLFAGVDAPVETTVTVR